MPIIGPNTDIESYLNNNFQQYQQEQEMRKLGINPSQYAATSSMPNFVNYEPILEPHIIANVNPMLQRYIERIQNASLCPQIAHSTDVLPMLQPYVATNLPTHNHLSINPSIHDLPKFRFIDQANLKQLLSAQATDNFMHEFTTRASLEKIKSTTTNPTTLAEIHQQQVYLDLLHPEARFMQALGIPRNHRIVSEPYIHILPGETLQELNTKVDQLCSKIVENKTFWQNTFNALLPEQSSCITQHLLPPEPLFLDSLFEKSSSENYATEKKGKTLNERLTFLRLQEEERQAYRQKYAVITDCTENLKLENATAIPYTGKIDSQISSFQQAIEDHKHLSIYKLNQITFPEGSPERLTPHYLEKNIKGPISSVGGNFAYFTASLLCYAKDAGILPHYIEKKDLNSPTYEHPFESIIAALNQPSAIGAPAPAIPGAKLPITIASTCLSLALKNPAALLGFSLKTSQILDSFQKKWLTSDQATASSCFHKGLECSSLAEVEAEKLQQACVAGVNPEIVLKKTSSALYHIGITGKPDLYFKNLEACLDFKRAEAFLKPYRNEFMPEAKVRELIEQTGIKTYPRPEGIPENFLVKITERSGGMEYVHPTNNHIRVRVMPGKPHSPNPHQQHPYVIWNQHGKFIDEFGNIVTQESPAAHIPLEKFVYKGS